MSTESWRGGANARGGRAFSVGARRTSAAVARRAFSVGVLAFLVGALALAAGCQRTTPLPVGTGRNDDAAVFQECDSVCVRPSDCVRTFNDAGICPPGFVCALRFSGCRD
jgi:hypothetical protein